MAGGAPPSVAHGLRHTSLRYFNVVGSGADDLYDASPHNLFPLVFRAVDAGEAPKVFGTDYPTPDGSCVRDYIHVADLAEAHVLAAARLDEGRPLAPAYNIATGTGASVLEVIGAVGRVLDIDLTPETSGTPSRRSGPHRGRRHPRLTRPRLDRQPHPRRHGPRRMAGLAGHPPALNRTRTSGRQ